MLVLSPLIVKSGFKSEIHFNPVGFIIRETYIVTPYIIQPSLTTLYFKKRLLPKSHFLKIQNEVIVNPIGSSSLGQD